MGQITMNKSQKPAIAPTIPDRKERLAAQGHFRNHLLKTPFHERIATAMNGGHWNDWAGYQAATYIEDIELEYFAIRSTASVFDITPMVKYRIEGRDAESYLNRLTLRDVSRQAPGRVQYTAWCDDDGMVLDDGTLFRLNANKFHLYCQEFHLPWLLDSAIGFDVEISDITGELAGLALQGPTSAAILREAGFKGIDKLKPFDLVEFSHEGELITISRTGFTGDLGYELFVANNLAVSLWDRIFAAGKLMGIRPIGSQTLDMARIEAGFIVANADFVASGLALRSDRTRQPDEIGLGWMVDLEKPYFNGRNAIAHARKHNLNKYVLVGLEIEGNEPAIESIVYHKKTNNAGLVTAAIWSPTAKNNIAIASMQRSFVTAKNSELWVEIYASRELQYHKMMKRARIVERPVIKLGRRVQTPPADR